jgi:SAM-dependent methyltransferase
MSDDWTSGYHTDIGYTHGYYRELSPVMLEFALLSRMQRHRAGKPLRYLELGYGQGLSLNVHAATVPGEYWGTDFNPAQAANAKDLAAASGAHLRALDSSFEELESRDDLPLFDMIVLHGVWSWISDQNRRTIVKIARQHLAVGGIFYISYNSTPGWSAAMPLRHLMSLHEELASGEAQGTVLNIDAALAFAQTVVDSKAAYFRANPAVAERLKKITEQNKHYVAHEYFNADWLPMPFSDVASQLSDAKLSFAASANLIDHNDGINLTGNQQKLLGDIRHPVLKESVRDYMVNQQFRKDIWVKGARPLPWLDQAAQLNAQSFILLTPVADVPLKVVGSLGETQLQAEIFQPVIEFLAKDGFAPKTGAELAGGLPKLTFAQIMQVLVLLSGTGHVSPTQPAAQSKQAQGTSDGLNARLLANAEFSADVNHLASPVIGGAVGASRFQQLFLKSIKAGRKTPAEWAADAWRPLQMQGQRLMKDGHALDKTEDNLAELKKLAEDFNSKRLPIMKALKII